MSIELKILACLSTSHVSEETARELDLLIESPVPTAARINPAIWQGQIVAERWSSYGWFVWLASSGRALMPSDLRACIELAEAAGASWLQFDRDCPPIDALPVFDW